MPVTRRKFLKWAGTANLALIASKTVSGASNRQFPGYSDGKGVLYDSTLCIGCRQCEVACALVNDLPKPEKPLADPSVFDHRRRTSNDAFTVVNRYDVSGSPATTAFRKIQCNHCLEPACAAACFVKAFNKTSSGAVVYDESVCVGCRYCMVACPFEIPTYEYHKALTPRVLKCTLCHPRITQGLLPGCVLSCPTDALVFGKRSDLINLARQRISRSADRYIDHIYGENEMGGTSWLTLSGTPFSTIGMNENLGNRPAIEYTAGTLEAIPLVVGLWPVFLTGAYFMNQRREKIALQERQKAIEKTATQVREEMTVAQQAAIEKLERAKQKEIDDAVKAALAAADTQADDPKL